MKKISIYLSFYVLALLISFSWQLNTSVVNYYFFSVMFAEYFIVLHRILLITANLLFYFFYIELYSDSKDRKMQKWFYIGLTIVFGLLILMMLINDSLEFIANIIVMIHSIVLYVPASYYAYKTFKKMEKWSETRWIFYYAFLMMIYSIISWIFIICNVLWDEITHILYGPFFYLSNLMLFIAVLSGYFGYIYPKWFRKIVEKRIGHKIDKE